jgi:HD-GYP domain-containing protein (c-di-GMP phosphodiesterase class II)
MRLLEVVGVLALSAEVATTGEIGEQALRTALLSSHLAGELGLPDETRRDVLYVALLRFIGCVGDSDLAAAFLGDETEIGRRVGGIDFGDPAEFLPNVLRERWRGIGPLSGFAAIAQVLTVLPRAPGISKVHCEVAASLANELEVGESVVHGITHFFERWNGKGAPNGVRGEAIPEAARIVQAAETAVIARTLGGDDAVAPVLERRAGRALDPRLVEHLTANPSLLSVLDVPSPWTAVLAAEPSSKALDAVGTERALGALADFTDLKSRFTRRHSRGVASLARRAGKNVRIGNDDALHAAALLHDLGRVGISAAYWDKPGPLTDAERERVRMHAYFTERVLARAGGLREAAAIASLDHERLDGTGYHRAFPAAAISQAGRILAAADAYHAMLEDRPHRAARSADEAASELKKEGRAGRLCPDAIDAVLSAAGHTVKRRTAPAGLTDREVDVLRLCARGLTNKEIATRLEISTKTAGHHLQHIYGKIGVTTRAAATLFAMRNGLVEEDQRET